MGILKTCTTIAAAGVLAAAGAFAQQAANGNNSDAASGMHSRSSLKAADMKFAQEAAAGGMEEVELGKLAVQKAQNDKVKQFGQRMIDDHTKANDQLKSLAAKDNITLPTDLDAKGKAMVAKYSNLSGAAFDRSYMRDMVKDHQKDVAEFQKESTSGSNDDLKGFAAATLPTLQDHLKMAQETASMK